MKGRLFNIQRFSVHDGPGIRTTFFMKGCNLRCQWCHNPESWSAFPQMEYFPDRCVHCHSCEKVCEHGVHIEGRLRIGAEGCVLCRKCESVCMHDALHYIGAMYTPEEALEIALRDKPYYDNSSGGVTVSGGEPLLQAEFVKEFFSQLKQEGIGTALDTAGNVPFEEFEKVLPYTDLVLLDLKIMDGRLHQKYTGVPNKRILENTRRLMSDGVRLAIRVPVIAGINDNEENLNALQNFIGNYRNLEEVRFLPYHSMGISKAESLHIPLNIFHAPDPQYLENARERFGESGK